MNVTQTVPAFLGGISQQPDYEKSPGMLRDIKNAYPDLSYGLQKRHGARWEYDLLEDSYLDDAKWFTFRDADDQPYVGAIVPPSGPGVTPSRPAGVKMWDALTGQAQIVQGNFGYLALNSRPEELTKEAYKIAAINQTAVIVNRNAIVKENITDTPGILTGELTTIAELPESGSSGEIYHIINSTSELDDYYVQWASGPNSTGAWVEVAEPGIPDGLNINTMPHVLVKVADNQFSFAEVPYKDRMVGNEATNPHPSFMGGYIENAFFYLNRVGFLSGNNVIMSQPLRPDLSSQNIQSPNFYRISTLVQSPADPVDINASTIRSITLRSVQPTYQGLLVFADGEQFTLFSESGIVSPDTATLKSMSTYEYHGDVDAVELGDNHYFLSETLRHTRVWRMSPRGEAMNPDVTEVSKIITDYIPNNIDILEANTQNGFIALASHESKTIYLYRTFIENGEVLLQSWYTWELPGTIHAIVFQKDEMLTVTKQDGRFALSSIILNTIPEEDVLTNIDQQPGLNSILKSIGPYLDFWLGQERFQQITPEGETVDSNGEVTYNDYRIRLPFNYPTSIPGMTPIAIQTKDELSRTYDIGTGAIFPIEIDANEWIIKGNFKASDNPKFVVGYRYEYDLVLPNYFMMTETGADFTAHLNIDRYRFIFKDASEVQYMLQLPGRNDMKNPDDWTVVKPQPESRYYYSDVIPVGAEVQLMLPIHQRNTNFNMRIYSDSPYPVTLNKLMWEGSYNPRYYRRV